MPEKNKLRLAVGITKDQNHDFMLSVKGISENVDLIVKLARRYNIPVIENPRLTKLLHQLPADMEIPEKLLPAIEAVIEGVEGKAV